VAEINPETAGGTTMKRNDFKRPSGVWVGMVMAAVIFIISPVPAEAQDPGVNQPGAAGNVHRDPGINQPGAAGNRGRVYR